LGTQSLSKRHQACGFQAAASKAELRTGRAHWEDKLIELIKARETFIELSAEKVETQVSSSILIIIFITIFIIINIIISIFIIMTMTIIAINKPRSHWSRVSKNHPNF